MTENQKLYQKQLKRIERAIKNQAKKGYVIDLPESIFIMPKRVTAKKLTEMQSLTPKKLTALYGYYMEDGERKKGIKPKPRKPRKPRKPKKTKSKYLQELMTGEEENMEQVAQFANVKTQTKIADDIIWEINDITKYNVENADKLKKECVGLIISGLTEYGEQYVKYLEQAESKIFEAISDIKTGHYLEEDGSEAKDLTKLLEFNEIKSELTDEDFFSEDWSALYD